MKTNGLLGPSWVLRHLSLSPHHLEWHSDQSRTMIVGTVQLVGGSLLLTEAHEAPTIPEGTFGLCMELDWSGRDFLPMFFTSPQEAHDAVLVSALSHPPLDFASQPWRVALSSPLFYPSGCLSPALPCFSAPDATTANTPHTHQHNFPPTSTPPPSSLHRPSLPVQPACPRMSWRLQG